MKREIEFNLSFELIITLIFLRFKIKKKLVLLLE